MYMYPRGFITGVENVCVCVCVCVIKISSADL